MISCFSFLFLPGTRASAAPLLSRVGCRCAGTSQPVHRSRAEAAAPCRSTGTAAAAPEADRGPPAPALLRFRFTTTEERKEEMRLSHSAVGLLCTDGARVSVRGRILTLPLLSHHHTGLQWCCVQGQRRDSEFQECKLRGT